MIIDTSTRNRLAISSNALTSNEEAEPGSDNDFSSPALPKMEFGSRFRVSAQEWLPTWRIIE